MSRPYQGLVRAEGVNQSQGGSCGSSPPLAPLPAPVPRGSACGCSHQAGFPPVLPAVALFGRWSGKQEYFSPPPWKASSPLHFLQLRPGSSSLDGPSLCPGPQLQRAATPAPTPACPSGPQRIRGFPLLVPVGPFPALARPSLPVRGTDVPLRDRLFSSLNPGW